MLAACGGVQVELDLLMVVRNDDRDERGSLPGPPHRLNLMLQTGLHDQVVHILHRHAHLVR